MKVIVLRLGHRKHRDARITTHCALVARAFGANEIVLSGECDNAVLESVEKVARKWGGAFHARYEAGWLNFLKKFRGVKVHLTFYGLPLHKKIGEIRAGAAKKKLLVVVGAQKVPRAVYTLCDYNISITTQPHSEVAALAVFLHELFQGRELEKEFPEASIKITPSERKKVVEITRAARKKAKENAKKCEKQQIHYHAENKTTHFSSVKKFI